MHAEGTHNVYDAWFSFRVCTDTQTHSHMTPVSTLPTPVVTAGIEIIIMACKSIRQTAAAGDSSVFCCRQNCNDTAKMELLQLVMVVLVDH